MGQSPEASSNRPNPEEISESEIEETLHTIDLGTGHLIGYLKAIWNNGDVLVETAFDNNNIADTLSRCIDLAEEANDHYTLIWVGEVLDSLASSGSQSINNKDRLTLYLLLDDALAKVDNTLSDNTPQLQQTVDNVKFALISIQESDPVDLDLTRHFIDYHTDDGILDDAAERAIENIGSWSDRWLVSYECLQKSARIPETNRGEIQKALGEHVGELIQRINEEDLDSDDEYQSLIGLFEVVTRSYLIHEDAGSFIVPSLKNWISKVEPMLATYESSMSVMNIGRQAALWLLSTGFEGYRRSEIIKTVKNYIQESSSDAFYTWNDFMKIGRHALDEIDDRTINISMALSLLSATESDRKIADQYLGMRARVACARAKDIPDLYHIAGKYLSAITNLDIKQEMTEKCLSLLGGRSGIRPEHISQIVGNNPVSLRVSMIEHLAKARLGSGDIDGIRDVTNAALLIEEVDIARSSIAELFRISPDLAMSILTSYLKTISPETNDDMVWAICKPIIIHGDQGQLSAALEAISRSIEQKDPATKLRVYYDIKIALEKRSEI